MNQALIMNIVRRILLGLPPEGRGWVLFEIYKAYVASFVGSYDVS